ncbi:hypothetical protein ACFVJS_19325 [Nocardioides sp. NPDC057772]|uniref:hypothetical protein n=1 Tax=Nocardioides sp. NPDC057772 TaxID=3346245 RepID=UPI00366FA872
MKVKVSVTLDIDVDAWVLVNGVERDEVRADVHSWARYLLFEAAADNDVLSRPTPR